MKREELIEKAKEYQQNYISEIIEPTRSRHFTAVMMADFVLSLSTPIDWDGQWTNNKPDSIGLWFRSNPALQKDISQQTVYLIDGKLMTHHPQNDMCKLINVDDMPNSFLWLKIPYPSHYKKSISEQSEIQSVTDSNQPKERTIQCVECGKEVPLQTDYVCEECFNKRLSEPVTDSHELTKPLLEILNEITEGKGRYDMDKLKHASNTIDDMKELAHKAINLLKGDTK